MILLSKLHFRVINLSFNCLVCWDLGAVKMSRRLVDQHFAV